ncbi:hypothetical protein J6590_077569 [Homalodisca vitripennis]|nr:hypothetical protein J6590_077569 [Homalodisca vitripennis]
MENSTVVNIDDSIVTVAAYYTAAELQVHASCMQKSLIISDSKVSIPICPRGLFPAMNHRTSPARMENDRNANSGRSPECATMVDVMANLHFNYVVTVLGRLSRGMPGFDLIVITAL